jgi:hypothetical protein
MNLLLLRSSMEDDLSRSRRFNLKFVEYTYARMDPPDHRTSLCWIRFVCSGLLLSSHATQRNDPLGLIAPDGGVYSNYIYMNFATPGLFVLKAQARATTRSVLVLSGRYRWVVVVVFRVSCSRQ